MKVNQWQKSVSLHQLLGLDPGLGFLYQQPNHDTFWTFQGGILSSPTVIRTNRLNISGGAEGSGQMSKGPYRHTGSNDDNSDTNGSENDFDSLRMVPQGRAAGLNTGKPFGPCHELSKLGCLCRGGFLF